MIIFSTDIVFKYWGQIRGATAQKGLVQKHKLLQKTFLKVRCAVAALRDIKEDTTKVISSQVKIQRHSN